MSEISDEESTQMLNTSNVYMEELRDMLMPPLAAWMTMRGLFAEENTLIQMSLAIAGIQVDMMGLLANMHGIEKREDRQTLYDSILRAQEKIIPIMEDHNAKGTDRSETDGLDGGVGRPEPAER